jgi:hypothetical protein
VSVILLSFTLTLFNAGEAFTSRGGMLSFGPPVGIPIWPQPALPMAIMYNSETMKREKSICFDLINGN